MKLIQLVTRNENLEGVARQLITDDVLQPVALNQRACTNVDLTGCSEITDDGITYLAKACKQLAHIGLEGCVNISSKGLEGLVMRCPHMTLDSLESCRAELVTAEALDHVTKNQSERIQMDLSMCKWITNETLALVSQRYSMLLE